MTVKAVEKVKKLGAKKICVDDCARWIWEDGSIAIDWYEDKIISGVYAEIPATSNDYKALTKKSVCQ